ncbi:MAG: YfhO family protein, partial [Croceimicrobium sp.]
ADEELAAIKGLDAANTAVLRSEYADKVGELRKAKGSIRLTSYDPEKLEYSYNADQANLAVFSEIFYPDHWVAKIDNEEVEILRANYVLRALKVPAGQHTITFEYRDKTSGTSNTIALISSLLILLAVPGMLFLDYKKSAA